MARFYGTIGYCFYTETSPGVWEETITEKNYRGDITLDQQRWQSSEQVNDNLNLDNSISILADPYALQNYGNIRYVVWNGAKWKIQSLSIKRPRIILQIGGLYNGG